MPMTMTKPKPAAPSKWKLSPGAADLRLRLRQRWSPPPRLKLSEWSESNIILPKGQSARPGKYRNWPYLKDPLDSIGDKEVEYVTLMKATRIGFTKGLVVAIGAVVDTNPSPMILLVPRDIDVPDYAENEIDTTFEASPSLRDKMKPGKFWHKKFKGGASLKILAARSPANLRRHDAKFLFCDEVDAMDLTKEGDPLSIAQRRTMAHADRKIVWGSTPTEEGLSNIERKYNESDQRIYEVPCPHCGEYFEILWQNIRWDEGQPETAHCICPHCEQRERDGGEPAKPILEHLHKREMVFAGRWRATKPEITNHHGYRLNALVSLLAKASWPILAGEWLTAKRGGPAEMQVFTNTALAKTWKTSLHNVSPDALADRVEPFGLGLDGSGRAARVPANVVLITAGADVQDDRIEVTLLGWPLTGSPYVLGHAVIDGSTLDLETWKEFDEFLKTKWDHPNGWKIGIDATAVDSGGSEGRTQRVYDFCEPRLARRIYAIAGRAGARPVWAKAQKVKNNARLYIVGHDQVKTTVLERLSIPMSDPETGEIMPNYVPLSEELPESWFEQATNETRRIRYVRNRAIIEFQPKAPGKRVEALDCTCYAWAVKSSPAVKAINLKERADRRPDPTTGKAVVPKKRGAGDFASRLNQ